MARTNKDCEMAEYDINDEMLADKMADNDMTELDGEIVVDNEDATLVFENEDCDANVNDVDMSRLCEMLCKFECPNVSANYKEFNELLEDPKKHFYPNCKANHSKL